MIIIRNKRVYRGKGEYIGRPSLLGNPFRVGIDGTREEVVNVLYRNWLWCQIKAKSPVYFELERLARSAKDGDLILICWCKLSNKEVLCHADVIKNAIEWLNKNYGVCSSVGRAHDSHDFKT